MKHATTALTAALGEEFVLVSREPTMRTIIDMHSAIASSKALAGEVGSLIGYVAIREAYAEIIAAATPKTGG